MPKLTDEHHALLRAEFGDAYMAATMHSMALDGGRHVHALLRLDGSERHSVKFIGAGLGDWAEAQVKRALDAVRSVLNLEVLARGVPSGFVDAVMTFDKVAARVGVEGS